MKPKPRPKIAIILGTRPEIIKLSPVICVCQRQGINFFILHTNQHYSENLDQLFFRELCLPQAAYNLKIGSGGHGQQTGRMLAGVEEVLLKEWPQAVLVQGDTNTVLAGVLAASKLGIKTGHVEAGLRSFNRTMPEELNRIATDHLSDFLFAPTLTAKQNLANEGIKGEKVVVTGNTVVDALYEHQQLAMARSKILLQLKLLPQHYLLSTLHRQENVDHKDRLHGILQGLSQVAKKLQAEVVLPLHPRTRKMIKLFKLKVPFNIRLIEPVGYLDFLRLEMEAKLIMTDSGGVQEEACILKVPCVTLRDNTERPETVEVKANILAGANPSRIVVAATKMVKAKSIWRNPFGKGKAAEKIVQYLLK